MYGASADLSDNLARGRGEVDGRGGDIRGNTGVGEGGESNKGNKRRKGGR